MKITYDNYKEGGQPNPQFSNIDRIVLRSPNLPEITRYYGSDEELIGLEDFNEYGWEFVVSKDRYNSSDPLSNLTKEWKKAIGTEYNDIKTVRETLFPTVTEEKEGDDTISYFGTISVGSQKLLMVDIPGGYSEALLFDTSDLTYMKAREGEAVPKIKITFDTFQEILYSKVVWFVITNGSEEKNNISDINISYLSWEKSRNSHRKMNQYLLRQDDKSRIDGTLEVLEDLGNTGFYVDATSNTLVGNRKMYEYPILNEKLTGISNNRKWDRNISYYEGDVVVWKGVEYVSLENNNRANIPGWSPLSWTLKEGSGDYDIKWASIMSTGDNSEIIISPSRSIISSGFSRIQIINQSSSVLKLDFPKGTYKFDNDYSQGQAEYYSRKENGGKLNLWISLDSLGTEEVLIPFKTFRQTIPVNVYVDGVLVKSSLTPIGNSEATLGEKYSFTYQVNDNPSVLLDLKKIVKSSLLEGNVIELSEIQTLPELNDDGTLTLEDTLSLPVNISYDLYLEGRSYSISFIEYPGFILDYIKREIPVTSVDPVVIKFTPRDRDFFENPLNTGGIQVQALTKDGTWARILFSTDKYLSSGNTSFTDSNIFGSHQIWYLRLVDNKYYTIEIPKLLGNLNLKVSKYEG